MKITDLKPTIVWKFFHQVTQVPRPSKKEGKMIEFLESFAKEYKIAIKKDEAGNLLMSKPATPGMEDRPVVVLQSHMDMVCEKNNGTKHDFDNDPIETIVDGEWLRANGTTLGADNGIGVAAELALLASDDIQHGPIECLFTVDEETGLTGAKALKEGFMTGDILLNLDSEDEGEIFMGCAGGKDTQATFHYEPVPTSDKMQYFRIDVKGLNGGHSGGEIHKGLGNANKILVRFLLNIAALAFPNAMEAYSQLVETVGIGETTWISLLATVILAPISEELLFRGLTLRFLRSAGVKFAAANLIQALFFGILHMNLVQGIYAFAVGLVLGYVAGKCRTVFLPILLHLCFNIAGTVLAALLSGNTGWLMQGILTVAGVLMLTGAFLLVQKEMKNL